MFTRVPYGLKDAPATLPTAIDIILASVRRQFSLVYLDDIIVSVNRQWTTSIKFGAYCGY